VIKGESMKINSRKNNAIRITMDSGIMYDVKMRRGRMHTRLVDSGTPEKKQRRTK
jgi:hypothetical protein